MPYSIQAVLPTSSGLSVDVVVNTFSVSGPSVNDPGPLAALAAQIVGFYNEMPSGGGTGGDFLTNFFSPELSSIANGAVVKIYDISDSLHGQSHGSPVYTLPFTLRARAGSAGPLPRQVAVVARLETGARAASPVEVPDNGTTGVVDPGLQVDRPKARQTGRLYIGPLNTACLETAPGGFVANSFRNSLALSFVDLAEGIRDIAGTNWALGVWSRRNGQVMPAHFVHVDNRWDTQRRRLPKASAATRMALPALALAA